MNKLSSRMDKVGTVGVLTAAALSTLVMSSVLSEYDDNTPEEVAKDFVGGGLTTIGFEDPFAVELAVQKRGFAKDGTINIGENLGRFTVYSNATFSRVSKLWGFETDDIEIQRDGYLVGHLKLPDLPTIDPVEREDGGLHFTAYGEGGRETGINVEDIVYEILRPETARLIDGKKRCLSAPGDVDFHGCIEGVDTDDELLSRIKWFGANDDQLAADAANNTSKEYGRLTDPCFFENVLIPEFNAIYRAEGFAEIDGENQSDQAMKVLVRYLLRSRVSPGVHASEVSINLVGIWKPDLPFAERVTYILNAMGVGDSIDPTTLNESDVFCLEKTSTYDGDFVYLHGFNERDGRGGVDLRRVALGGMEFPPQNLIFETGELISGGDK